METALEKILVTTHRPEMEAYILAHPSSFEELIKLAIADKQPYSWRAAWLLWSCMDQNDIRIRKYVKQIVNVLPNRNDSQKRELLKILEQMEIKEQYEGLLFNSCVAIWEKPDKQPSVRLNAFKVLAKIAKKYPELIREVTLLTEKQYTDSLSLAVKKSLNKILSALR